MMTFMRLMIVAALSIPFLLISACTQQDTEKTRQEAAKATEQIKEGSKVAAVELKQDAKEAAKQTKAIANDQRSNAIYRVAQTRERVTGHQWYKRPTHD